jgi:uncharacterized protein (DUF2147 family)
MRILKIVLVMLSLVVSSQALAGSSPYGTWKTVDDKTKKSRSLVKLYKGKDGKLHGKIVKLFQKKGEDPKPRCTECSGSKKNKPIIGMEIISGLSLDGDEWSGGKVLDPANGKTYRCKLWVENGGKKIKLRGYVAFFYRTQYWYRVK